MKSVKFKTHLGLVWVCAGVCFPCLAAWYMYEEFTCFPIIGLLFNKFTTLQTESKLKCGRSKISPSDTNFKIN